MDIVYKFGQRQSPRRATTKHSVAGRFYAREVRARPDSAHRRASSDCDRPRTKNWRPVSFGSMSLTPGLGLPLAITGELIDANGRRGRDEGKPGPRRGWVGASGESRRAKALDSGDETLGWYCTDSATPCQLDTSGSAKRARG
ncbi:hypothetical protein FRC08_018724 [Ceratobasidium sp. 394]|nr:hypothetical protein FRC08_018724 [Ceratobasidium sp. 394]